MRRTALKRLLALAALLGLLRTLPLIAHCEIPCGIYDDETTFTAKETQLTTIEKSMKEIARLSAEKDLNQIVRWVANKDAHADEFQHNVSQYFLTQRVKPAAESDTAGYPDYVRKVALLHRMLVTAAKAKQTTDLAHVATLRALLTEFKTLYLKK